MLLHPTRQKFNTFNTFTIFTTFKSALNGRRCCTVRPCLSDPSQSAPSRRHNLLSLRTGPGTLWVAVRG
jgi:hypothetical protein